MYCGFLSPGNPQKNGVVEQGFGTLYSLVKAMMAHGVLNENLNTVLWPKYMETATKLENIMVNPHEETIYYEKLYGKMPEFWRYGSYTHYLQSKIQS